jgi:hypothetical protein
VAAAWRQPSRGNDSGSAAAALAAQISLREEKSSVQGKYRLNKYRPNIAQNLLKNQSCLRKFRAIFGQY